MILIRVVLVGVFLVLGTCYVSTNAMAETRTLRVALYPYVPLAEDLKLKVKEGFEDKNPDIRLEFVDLSYYYYDDTEPDGLLQSLRSNKIDVVEFDSVFLADLVEEELIQPMPAQLVEQDGFIEMARKGVAYKGVYYGIPHWTCGNFLFINNDDPALEELKRVRDLGDLCRVLERTHHCVDPLMTDFHGSSTLGEKYLDALMDSAGSRDKVIDSMKTGIIDPRVKAELDLLYSFCDPSVVTSGWHHELGQHFARHFARRESRTFIGYSERLHFMINEAMHSIADGSPTILPMTTKGEPDIAHPAITVRSAPMSVEGSYPLGWVDAVGVSTSIDPALIGPAMEFIKFYAGEELTLDLLENSPWGEAPRYLLPARRSTFQALAEDYPVYDEFLFVIDRAVTITDRGLNSALRKIGDSLEAEYNMQP